MGDDGKREDGGCRDEELPFTITANWRSAGERQKLQPQGSGSRSHAVVHDRLDGNHQHLFLTSVLRCKHVSLNSFEPTRIYHDSRLSNQIYIGVLRCGRHFCLSLFSSLATAISAIGLCVYTNFEDNISGLIEKTRLSRRLLHTSSPPTCRHSSSYSTYARNGNP